MIDGGPSFGLRLSNQECGLIPGPGAVQSHDSGAPLPGKAREPV